MKSFIKFLFLGFGLTMAIIVGAKSINPTTLPLCDQKCQQTATQVNSTINSTVESTLQAAAPTLQDIWKSSSDPAEVWGNSGVMMFTMSAQMTASRNPAGQALTVAQKKALQPFFGTLVDRVQVNYGAKLMDRWTNGKKEVHVGSVDSAAQTFCDRIYLKEQYKANDRGQISLIAHELAHAAQCERLGGAQKFGYSYFRSYYEANQKYANNPLEKEARMIAAKLK
jgi:Domain of unknown function (DUF4157)